MANAAYPVLRAAIWPADPAGADCFSCAWPIHKTQ